MKHPKRLSLLFIIGILAAGSTALGVYYYFVYEPPLAAAEAFMTAMEKKDTETLKELVMVTPDRDSTAIRRHHACRSHSACERALSSGPCADTGSSQRRLGELRLSRLPRAGRLNLRITHGPNGPGV